MGIRAFRAAARRVRIPVVGIGGLRPGAATPRAAAVDALLGARDPVAAAGAILAVPGGRRLPAGERRLVGVFLAAIGRVSALALGPGDDAVVLRGSGIAAAVDLTVEAVHYDPGTPARDAGRKAAGRALSDLAAVGAEPVGVLVGMAVRSARRARGIEAGVAGIARILGGDTKESPGPEAISVTALGRVDGPPPLPRSGGRPGDALFATGPLGGSRLGRHLRPRPRIREGLALRRGRLATACIDVSDGLATDLHRLCRASGTGALLESWRVPVHRDARRGGETDPLGRALLDGEDYELLFAAPPEMAARIEARGVAGTRVFRVGRLVHAAAGVVVQGEDGLVRDLPDEGWFHFRERLR
jgi:thiamine-monophosphate kinase